jgi:uncharacterized protein with von Willebrand factor type A (vWA) domain
MVETSLLEKKIFYFSLRTALVKNPEHFTTYDLVFRKFWSLTGQEIPFRGDPFGQSNSKSDSLQLVLDVDNKKLLDRRDEVMANKKRLAIYSPIDRKSYHRFRPVDQTQVRQIKRLIRKFNRRVATRPGRRLVQSRLGDIDLRASIQKSVSKGGLVLLPKRTKRKVARSKIVVLADVSGSMDTLSEQIYLLLYLLRRLSRRCEIFVFSTNVARLTGLLSLGDLESTAYRLSMKISIWGSGTKIGECIGKVLKSYGSILDRYTTVIIISDGWDLGDADLLRKNIAELKRRTSEIIWLNPLASRKGYEPACIGMKTALPYVDVFASTEIFSNKQLFESYFGKTIGPL